jgi:NAD(P)-dependent dehydrogenase (short-subunit alcohol dehydrogenase family)
VVIVTGANSGIGYEAARIQAQRGYPHRARSSPASHNLNTARRLWQVSEELTGIKFEV